MLPKVVEQAAACSAGVTTGISGALSAINFTHFDFEKNVKNYNNEIVGLSSCGKLTCPSLVIRATRVCVG